MAVLYPVLLVGVLVLIHELGHFVAAKLLDVKVLTFSVGYGRPLVRVKLGETDYQIGAFPLGGYTRILGIESTAEGGPRADADRSFSSRPLWQRLVIILAGPAANLMLPVAIYFAFFAGHTVLPAAVIGDVFDGGAAARAGLEPGDRVTEINGRAVRYWEELENAVRTSPGKELRLRVSRAGKTFERYVTPIEETARQRDGQVLHVGWAGITHAPFVPMVGVIDATSPAARAGLRTGDLIISVDGQAVRNWRDVTRVLGKFARRTSIVYVRGSEVPGVPQVELLAAGFADLVPETKVGDTLERQSYTGLERAEMFIAHVDAGSPADGAGLKPGDLVTELDGKPVVHWYDFDQRLQAEPDHTFKIAWRRATGETTETMTADVTQVWRRQLDEYNHTVQRLVFGASNDIDRGAGAMVPIDGRFGYALSKAFERTGETISTMASGFVQIISGDSPKSWGGPVMMLRAAAVSGTRGWDTFFLMLALISVNLGLINLLPIPMLDGGHLLVFAIEAVRRKKLPAVWHKRIQLAGLVLVVIILILATGNDIGRWIHTR
ncbi:MAG TPA: site-2 protease family protein [Kofleriaceae bacterium]